MSPPAGSITSLGKSRARWLDRRFVFRALAILLALVPFVLLELTLRLVGIGRANELADPYVGFSAIRPLFELSSDGSRYEIPRSRHTHFAPESFPAVKADREFRIFCLGGSTVQGNPYSIETSFTTWLEISLNAADPSRRWDVVNCGGISYASYRLVPILKELLDREPDLFIVYTGQNEFLEDRTYGHVKRTSRAVRLAHELLAPLRSYQVFRVGCESVRRSWTGHSPPAARPVSLTGLDRSEQGATLLSSEVEALLDYRGGLEAYHRDDLWRDAVIAHYEQNLRRMVQLARDAEVPIILMNPVCNLRDSPPFKAQHRDGMTQPEIERWESLWSQARELYGRDYRAARELLRQAMAIDDQHAGLHYDLAKCYEALHQTDAARREYILAKELDVCPLRILEPMNDAVLDVAADTDTPLIDARMIFEKLSPGGIPGHEWLLDHVHPSITGHQVLAEALADELIRQRVVRPVPNWKQVRDDRYAAHVNSLSALYYARGQQHLDGLMNWAHGRVTRVRGQSSAAPGATSGPVARGTLP